MKIISNMIEAHIFRETKDGIEFLLLKRSEKEIYSGLWQMVTGKIEQPGAGLFQGFCAKCHQTTGLGKQGKIPKLAGNPAVLAENPTSLIRLLLEGSKTPETEMGPKPHKMPSFAKKFTNLEIAQVLSFVRKSWGNAASPVTEREVFLLRSKLEKKP